MKDVFIKDSGFLLKWREKDATAEGVREAEEEIRLEQIRADAKATRYLAEMNCPPDIKAFGERHKIPTFAEQTWLAGFIQGWRMARRVVPPEEQPE